MLAVVAKFPCGIFCFFIENIFVGRAETEKKKMVKFTFILIRKIKIKKERKQKKGQVFLQLAAEKKTKVPDSCMKCKSADH